LTIDAVIPARDEELTVAPNVAAAQGCRHVRDVIVVDDGSVDATAAVARAAGARVVARTEPGAPGSKALAMAAGVAATDARSILFLDADCVGLTVGHLDRICEPYVAGVATMSIGLFDYGRRLNPLVRHLPPLSGERVLPRWVFESIPPVKLDGYTVEVRLNEVVCEGRLGTVVHTMPGVHHRTKREKLGTVAGLAATWHMYRALLGLVRPVGDIRLRTYLQYLRDLTVLAPGSVSPARRPNRSRRSCP
jgi:glycosyltransferase involved in cell wall biosynthesis